ncbi:MAG: flagellar biosynthetic protein FliO [Desulfofustis sp.]|nr:flagellar biosynthetic protein FliO [Desulfofustis sp.]
MNGTSLLSLSLSLLLIGRADLAWALANEAPSLLNASLRMTWGLLVVLAVLLIIYVLIKKRLSLLQGRGKGLINIIETRHLLPKKSLFLVEVRGQEFLLGTGSDTIELIARIEPDRPRHSFEQILNTAESTRPQ